MATANIFECLSAINTMLGMANYGENITQNVMQEDLKKVVEEMNADFDNQNEMISKMNDNINLILKKLGVDENEIRK